MESDNPIDERLKASARKRREEFGPDTAMPNPTRVRLHEEIASLNRAEEKTRFWFTWPRVAFATAAVAFLVGLPLMWQWRQPSVSQTVSDIRPSAEAAPGNIGQVEREATDAAKQSAAATIAQNAAESAAAPAPAAMLAMKTRNVIQRFTQSPAQQNVNQSIGSAVLTNFQLEQDGEKVRVVDADGSTYTGRMEKLARNDARALVNQKTDLVSQQVENVARAKAVASRPSSEKEKKESANEYYIRASGYNVQLKKPLSFEGNYVAELPSANELQAKDEATAREARIVGTVKVEGQPPVQVDAKEVPP